MAVAWAETLMSHNLLVVFHTHKWQRDDSKGTLLPVVFLDSEVFWHNVLMKKWRCDKNFSKVIFVEKRLRPSSRRECLKEAFGVIRLQRNWTR